MKLDDPQIRQMVEIIDNALVSNNPAVITALKNLLTITALAHSIEPVEGPISEIVKEVEQMQQMIGELMNDIQMIRTEMNMMKGTTTTPCIGTMPAVGDYPPGSVWYNSTTATII